MSCKDTSNKAQGIRPIRSTYLCQMNLIKKFLLHLVTCALCLSSCTTIDLYEKHVAIPKNQWHSTYKPKFTFTIKDTTAAYEIYLVFRHNEKYNFNNIWLNIYTQAPGDTTQKFTIEKTLATNEKGWLATGMDDIYEHRLPLTLGEFRFAHTGGYTFTIEHIMREDPLLNVMNVGLRIEKK